MCKIPTESPEEKAAFDAITRNQNKSRMSLQEFFEAGYKLHAGDIAETHLGDRWVISENEAEICGSYEVTNDDKRYIVKSKELDAATAKADSQEWDGEGLPPVGAECEISIDLPNHEHWQQCKIEHYKKSRVWVSFPNNPDRLDRVYLLQCIEFRPIETPEQKAAREESERKFDFINSAFEIHCRNDLYTAKEVFEAMYDEGYRKPEHKDNK